MHRYTAYGVTVDSEIVLPELVAAQDVSSADGSDRVVVRVGSVMMDQAARANASPLVWARAGDVCLHYRGLASFHLTGGRQILVELAPDMDPSVLRLLLLGPALAVLLHQRGLLVLHASSVAVDGMAAAFAAEKGEGKSTLAAAMHARGHAVVADDLLAIDLKSTDDLLVHPGFPQLKLAPDSAAQISHDPDALPKLHPEYEKRAGCVMPGFRSSPLPLGCIFILQTGSDQRVVPLPPQQRVVELVRHSYLAPLLNSTGESAAHFKQVVALAARVPVLQMQRRRDMDALPEAVRQVEAVMRGAK